jgi:hypothetical protein
VIEDGGFVFHCFQGGAAVRYSNEESLSKEEVLARYKATLSTQESARLFPYGCEDGFGVQLWDFCDAIRSGRRPELDGEDGLRAKALCITCYESATLGQPVKYADVLSGAVNTYQQPIDAYWKLD